MHWRPSLWQTLSWPVEYCAKLTALLMRRLESTQWITSNYENYYSVLDRILFEMSAPSNKGNSKPARAFVSRSKKRHVLRRKCVSAFAEFDKLCDCGHRMQRSKAVHFSWHRWQWQEDDLIKTHIRTSRHPWRLCPLYCMPSSFLWYWESQLLCVKTHSQPLKTFSGRTGRQWSIHLKLSLFS